MSVLQNIHRFLASSIGSTPGDNTEKQKHQRELAAAALFIEVLKSDFEQKDEEWSAVHRALAEIFALSDSEIATLEKLADEEVSKAISLHSFTRTINESFSNQEKIRIVEMLWRIALADGVIDKHEQHIMRKIGSLLYIPHKDYIRAKQQARLHQNKNSI